MKIYNYNPERAEENKKRNDKRVASFRKISRIGTTVQRIVLAIMAVGVVMMMACVGIILTVYSEEAPNYAATLMIFITIANATIVCFMFKDQMSRKEMDNNYYDDIETQYHRLLETYKSVKVELLPDNTVLCMCEDEERVIELKELKPRYIKTAKKLTQPTLDVSSSCLWLPKCCSNLE